MTKKKKTEFKMFVNNNLRFLNRMLNNDRNKQEREEEFNRTASSTRFKMTNVIDERLQEADSYLSPKNQRIMSNHHYIATINNNKLISSSSLSPDSAQIERMQLSIRHKQWDGVNDYASLNKQLSGNHNMVQLGSHKQERRGEQLDEDEEDDDARKREVLAKQFKSVLKRKIIGNILVATLILSCLCPMFLNVSCQTIETAATTPISPTAARSSSSSEGSATSESVSAANSAAFNSISSLELSPEVYNATQSNQQQNLKIKPVNFTLVDEVFESVLSEDEVVKKWKQMDTQIQDGMKAILKMLFPQIVALSQDAKVSGDCSGGILKWILSLRNLRSWAIKMLDATGKPTAGIFEGSLTMFGNYKQCLDIRAPDEDEIEVTDQFEEYFRGQFCVIHLKPWMPIKQPYYNLNSTIEPLLRKNYKYYEKTLYDELAEIAVAFNFVDIRMDLCVPSTCTMADIQRVAELLSKKVEMKAKVMRCDITSRQTAFNLIDSTMLSWVLLPIALIVSSIISSLIVLFVKKEQSNLELQSFNNDSSDSRSQGKSIRTHLGYLSIQHNFKRLIRQPDQIDEFDVNLSNESMPESMKMHETKLNGSIGKMKNPLNNRETFVSDDDLELIPKPLPLYGLRNIFVLWFIVVQMTVELKYQYLRESLPLRNMILSYWPFQIIINSSFLFESLILITAFTHSFMNLESSLKQLVRYALDKYLRLILSIVAVIALTIITPLLSIESPIWRNFVESQSVACKSNGYLNLVFLQNFIAYDKICLPHSWIFCVEFQLIVVSIPLMLLLKQAFMMTENSIIIDNDAKNNDEKYLIGICLRRFLKSKAGLLSLTIIIIGFLVNFTSVYTNQLPPSWFYTFPDIAQKNYYFSTYLTKTWTHLSVFFIGLLGGYLCKTIIQLKNIKTIRSNFNHHPQPSPSSTSHLNSSHDGSTSTIMAIEQSTSSDNSNDGASGDASHDNLKKQLTSHLKRYVLSNQLASMVCMFAIIFSTYNWSTKQLPPPLIAALYDSLSRVLWSIALAGIMMKLCLNSATSGNIVIKFFNHPVLTFLGRLSFLAYLISPYVNTFILAVEEQSLFPSLIIIFHIIVGNVVIIYLISFLISLTVELPLRQLIRHI